MPYRVPHQRQDLPPNHDGTPGARFWFPPGAAVLGKVLSASATHFPDRGARAASMTAVAGGATTAGALAALPVWPMAAACTAAAGFLIGCGALVVRSAPVFTTWVGERGLAVVRRRPHEPAEPTVVHFGDVIAVERRAIAGRRHLRVVDAWQGLGPRGEPYALLTIVGEVTPGAIDPDDPRFDQLATSHPHHFARAARRAFARWLDSRG